MHLWRNSIGNSYHCCIVSSDLDESFHLSWFVSAAHMNYMPQGTVL